jgi:pyruvate/2-oxoglutarate dehydrogenase complex dihydrolipoamide acyltransferase (E2) component
MKGSNIFYSAVIIGSLMCAIPAAAAPAEDTPAAQQQAEAKAVQQATYTVQGKNITVVTFSDGTVAATVEGEMLVGAAAVQALENAGITLAVSPTGQITGVTLAPGVQTVQAAAPVTAAQAAEASKQRAQAQQSAPAQAQSTNTPAPVLSLLPANEAAGSSSMVMQQQDAVTSTSSSSGNPNSK